MKLPLPAVEALWAEATMVHPILGSTADPDHSAVLTAMSNPQPLPHNRQAEGTQESTSSAVSPSTRCTSPRTGHSWPGE